MLIDVGNALACACCVCSWGANCTDLPGSLALALSHVHTSYVVYVHGGGLNDQIGHPKATGRVFTLNGAEASKS